MFATRAADPRLPVAYVRDARGRGPTVLLGVIHVEGLALAVSWLTAPHQALTSDGIARHVAIAACGIGYLVHRELAPRTHARGVETWSRGLLAGGALASIHLAIAWYGRGVELRLSTLDVAALELYVLGWVLATKGAAPGRRAVGELCLVTGYALLARHGGLVALGGTLTMLRWVL